MPDGFATQSISELTKTVIVPILDLNKEEGIDFGELAKSLPLLTLFTKYLFSNALPNLNAFFPTKFIVNLLGNAADNQEFVSNKNNYMSLVEQYVSIYNTVSTQPDNPFDGNYSDHDKLANEKLEQLLKLEEIRTKLLNIGKDLFSDPAFYKNLSAEDTKLLSEFLEISKNDARNSKDYDLMLDRLSYILERFGETKTLLYDPLVIDMGKTGFELTDIKNGVHFDMDSNGYAEKTGWITGDDAFLALDRNGDGVINNSGELFGDRTLLKNGQYASSGFEALAEFDDNNDGIIDAHDQVYNQLLLWQDKNHDGISTPDELTTLSEAGIKSINLGCNSVNSSDKASGSVLANISSVQFSDGTETSVGEFKFNSNKLDTIDDINISISDDILALPNVRALGTVHSLHYAMAKDSTGTLKNLVEQFVASDNLQEREGLVEQILYFLCDAANIDPKSKGAYVDARQLAVLERFLDDTFIGAHSINPSYLAGPELTNLFKKLLSQYYCELSMHNLSKYTSDVISNTDENGKAHINVQLFNALATYDIVQRPSFLLFKI